MIAGAEGSTIDAFRAGQAEEQCLFYVGLSTPATALYAPTEKSNGHNRPLSPFLDGLGGHLTRRSVVPRSTAPGDGRNRQTPSLRAKQKLNPVNDTEARCFMIVIKQLRGRCNMRRNKNVAKNWRYSDDWGLDSNWSGTAIVYAASRQKSVCLSGDNEVSFACDSHPEQLRYQTTLNENEMLQGNDDAGMLGEELLVVVGPGMSARRAVKTLKSLIARIEAQG